MCYWGGPEKKTAQGLSLVSGEALSERPRSCYGTHNTHFLQVYTSKLNTVLLFCTAVAEVQVNRGSVYVWSKKNSHTLQICLQKETRGTSWCKSDVKVVEKDCSLFTKQSGCSFIWYHVSAALSNRTNWMAPCMQDLATCLTINLKFHTVMLYVKNGEEHHHETVSAETVVRRCTSEGLWSEEHGCARVNRVSGEH